MNNRYILIQLKKLKSLKIIKDIKRDINDVHYKATNAKIRRLDDE